MTSTATAAVNAPSFTGTIAERAMLVSLTIRQWTASKNDKSVAQDVATQHGADVDMGRYHKRLWSKTALEKVSKATGAARTAHYEYTLPWLDNGTRILPAALFLTYSDKMHKHETAIADAVSELLDSYDVNMSEARARLGTLFNAGDYPSKQELRDAFVFGFNILPMPTAQDFRVQLGDRETERIRREIEENGRAAIAGAMSEVYDRIKDVVGKMADRLTAYTVTADGKAGGVFRDTLVSNVRDLVELLPALNLTGDAALAALADRMREELTRYSPDTLRVNQRAREETAAAATAILDKMSDFI